MLRFIIPNEMTYDPDRIDGELSAFSKLSRCVMMSLTTPLAPDGYGRVTVDGIELSPGEMVMAVGFPLLLVPVGEVAKEYDRHYTVKMEGFKAKDGKKFPPLKFTLKTTSRKYQDPAYAEHDEQALIAAREGMVLLKNQNNLLPLAENSILNCFGEAQHMFRISATGASAINPRWKPNFMQAAADHSHFTVNQELADYYRTTGACLPDVDIVQRAKEQSNTALIFITRHSGEMQDNRLIKGQYYLSDSEREMVETVSREFEKTILILNTGYPIELGWTKELDIDAIIYTGFAGMLATYALVEILDGRTTPSGKLPDTFAWDFSDHPVSKNYPTLPQGHPHIPDAGSGVRMYYEEDIYVGYRYFDTFGKDVAFPFGHGLSYTSFAAEASGFTRTNEGVGLDVTVTNTGSAAGKEVIQLYLSAPDGKLEKPAHVLVGFEKTKLLSPGESQALHLIVDNKTMASFDEETTSWIMEAGEYVLSIGCIGSLKAVGSFRINEALTLSTVKHVGCPVEDFKRLTKADPTVDGTRSKLVPLEERFAVAAKWRRFKPQPLAPYTGKRITWPELQNDHSLLNDFVAQMSVDELCKLNVCAGSRWAPWQDGAAGSTFEMKKYKLPSYTVSDANAGLKLKKPNIGFPASSVIAATFNKDIAYTVGRVIAEESLENGVFLNLGPGMNLHRSVMNGRHPEYFSEDPFLTGTMAGHHGRGLEENGVGCCYKHLFCNNSDLSRKGSHSIASERALRELYFRSFELAFSIHKPSTVMTSYNAMNGMYPAENAELLYTLLREEWGFEGFVMSDWDAHETIDAVRMVNAGNSWITAGGPKWVKVLRKAAKEGKISRDILEHNVRRIIMILLKWNS